MPPADALPDPSAMPAFVALCGGKRWEARLADLAGRTEGNSWTSRVAQQRHALELAIARLNDPARMARAGIAERRLCALVQEAVALAATLPAPRRTRLREQIAGWLSGEATLVPLFHLLRTAMLARSRGFAVEFTGLAQDTPYDLLIRREDAAAEVVCETLSAEEGRPVLRGDWFRVVDAVSPELQTWLAAHPGRYLLKVTLPEGLAGEEQRHALQQRIGALLAEEKRQDSCAQAVLKLDPLVLAGAQQAGKLPARLREAFGPEAQLAVTADAGSGSVFVMAARAGQENAIAAAATRRMGAAAAARLTGERPGILAMFIDELDRAEWRALRETLDLEGATRRFLTTPAARQVVCVSCASRQEMLGAAPPDAAPGGELRFRNPGHPAAKLPGLAPAVLSSV